ncbi:transposase (plasmid) [Escherichia coli]|nr:transposase [Escherichia coli]WNU34934.1 transposase [Escherichia coli]
MELQDWRKEPRKNYSNEFKLRMVELASQPGACVAQIARENGVNDNVIFKSAQALAERRACFMASSGNDLF